MLISKMNMLISVKNGADNDRKLDRCETNRAGNHIEILIKDRAKSKHGSPDSEVDHEMTESAVGIPCLQRIVAEAFQDLVCDHGYDASEHIS